MKRMALSVFAVMIVFAMGAGLHAAEIDDAAVQTLQRQVAQFNANDHDEHPPWITNDQAFAFLRDNVPLLDCPDDQLVLTYNFRWWEYRKHIVQTPDGFVVTEFLPPVSWAGKYNSISCALGHHIYEGRWLRDAKYIDGDIRFWLSTGRSNLHRYSNWLADAMWARRCVIGDTAMDTKQLDALIDDFHQWQKQRQGPGGMYWQFASADGMEAAIGGDGYRPTINSYMFGAAKAIAEMAHEANREDVARQFEQTADEIRHNVMTQLWDADAKFFETRHRDRKSDGPPGAFVGVREQLGLTPWYFDLPDASCDVAWKQAIDPQGFDAPYGLTSAEQRDPHFAIRYAGHDCQWNGPSWPYATSVTLTALANLLNERDPKVINRRDYFRMLLTYARSQRLVREDGRVVPWIDEDQNPYTGDWIARTLHRLHKHEPIERGKDYNHSTFCDLVITGLIGLRPRPDDQVVFNPLVPAGTWDWFMLDHIPYHGQTLRIVWDRHGDHYHIGKGLSVFASGHLIATSETLQKVQGRLPQPPSLQQPPSQQ